MKISRNLFSVLVNLLRGTRKPWSTGFIVLTLFKTHFETTHKFWLQILVKNLAWELTQVWLTKVINKNYFWAINPVISFSSKITYSFPLSKKSLQFNFLNHFQRKNVPEIKFLNSECLGSQVFELKLFRKSNFHWIFLILIFFTL